MGTHGSSFSVKFPLMAAAVAVAGFGLTGRANAAVYAGNGGTGFGGPVGTGSLSVTDNGSGSITFAFTPGTVHPTLDGNNLVVYLSTGATGLSNTSTLTDDGDNGGTAKTIDAGRESISGYNDGSAAQGSPQNPPSRTEIAFPTGFAATYAISFANAYDGLFQLPTDGSGGLTYVDGTAPVNNVNTLTIPLSELGLTQGQSVSFVGTDIDGTSAYRSNEAIGAAQLSTNPGVDLSANGNPGFNNLITFTSADTYTTTAVPEPTGIAALSLGAAMLFKRRPKAALL